MGKNNACCAVVGFFSPKEIKFWSAFRFYPEKVEGLTLMQEFVLRDLENDFD